MSMTPLRWIGLGVGIMGALALVAVLLVLSAPVQTWAVRRALDAQPHVTGEIARVKAGWGGVTLEGVELQTTAGALRARRVEVEWNGWAALRSRVPRRDAHDTSHPRRSRERSSSSTSRKASSSGSCGPRVPAATKPCSSVSIAPNTCLASAVVTSACRVRESARS